MRIMKNTSPRTGSEGGFTLVELLIVVTLLGVVGAIVTTGIVTALDNARMTQSRVDALQELEIGGQRIARELRAAQVLVLFDDVDDEYDDLDPEPFSRQLGADGIRDGEEYTVTFEVIEGEGDEPAQLISDTDGAEQVLITLVNLDGDDPIFRYLNSRGEELECVVSCAATYASASRIEIVLRRNVGGDRPPVTVRTQVSVRNIRYG